MDLEYSTIQILKLPIACTVDVVNTSQIIKARSFTFTT